MRYLTPAVLVIVGAIHLLPLIGIVGAAKISSLYGISVTEPNLEILMRHRAVLFGLLGAFLVYSAFRRELHRLAWVAGLVSVVSFLVLAWSVGGHNAQLSKVVLADILALALLLAAGLAHVVESRSRRGTRSLEPKA